MTIEEQPVHPILSAAREIQDDVIRMRRRLHNRPEVGLQLPMTQAAVADALRDLKLEPQLGRSVSSVVATIEGTGQGRTILLRADMDALSLIESTGLPFASEHDGRMHACGHDAHVAMLLGAARILAERRADFAGQVVLMFQPGEEGLHGARLMIEDGLLGDANVERPSGAFALHISTQWRSGTINVRPGPMLAASDTVRITVRGRGGHASAPHHAVDPVTVAAEIVLGLQTMVGRRVDVFDPAVVTIAEVHGGTATNVIPETVVLGGTIRTLSEATRFSVRMNVRQLAAGIAAAHGAEVDVDIEPGYPVTVNDPTFTRIVMDAARAIAGNKDVEEVAEPVMGAEDFSYVLQEVAGTLAFLGARPALENPAMVPMLHSNRVIFDEDALAVGVAMHVAVALRHLAAD